MLALVLNGVICACSAPMMFYWTARTLILVRNNPAQIERVFNADERRLRALLTAIQ